VLRSSKAHRTSLACPAQHRSARTEMGHGELSRCKSAHTGIHGGAVVVLMLAMAVALVVAIPQPASAKGKLDQQQPNRDPFAFYSMSADSLNDALAQTFTAGVSGVLDTVELILGRVGDPGDLVVQIRTTEATADGTVPTQTVLGTSVVSSSKISTSLGRIRIPIQATVSAGTEYAIVLLSPSAAEGSDYRVGVGFGPDDYAAGHVANSTDDGASWFVFPANPDMTFATYVKR
jgi:hypothetical protein